MRLCSVTSLMKFYPLPEALAVIAGAGYQGVELWGGLPHAYTDDFYEGGKLDQATVDRCRKILDASGAPSPRTAWSPAYGRCPTHR